ncbi:MAG: hypothetical protein DRI95_12870 [Bacteroidetes bacterium]|nr:MAG: hypothetical protein DRI95_12870 [Bacteroidota bacterium]
MFVIDKTKYSIFLSVAIIYFFFNSTFLPYGLLYTTILSPLFFYWLIKKGQLPKMLAWSVLFLIPIPFHLYLGVNLKSYIISTGMIATVYVFLFTALEAIKQEGEELEKVFKVVLYTNALLATLVWIVLFFDIGNFIFWHYTRITHGVSIFPRLMLFAYEPSLYALLLSPVYLYFILKIITGQAKPLLLVILAVSIPLIISLSFGVIGGLAIAILLTLLIFFKKLPVLTKKYLFYSLAAIGIIGFVATYFWPENPVSVRVVNIFTGNDTSSEGRIESAFKVAIDLIDFKKAYMGVGPGQVKELYNDLLTTYYKIDLKSPIDYRIPNSIAEMLALYGFYGIIVKLGIEIYFFVRLKTYKNIYTFTLFIFIFLYQFTGSFTVNISEIGIWAIVFGSRIDSLDFQSLKFTAS